MPPHKWYQFLMKTMSPLAVGLIFAFLIALSSSHHPKDRNFTHPLKYSTRPLNHSIHLPRYSTDPTNYSTHPRNYSTHSRNHSTHLHKISTHLPKYSTHPPNYFTHPSNYSTHPRNYSTHLQKISTHLPGYSTHPSNYYTHPPNYPSLPPNSSSYSSVTEGVKLRKIATHSPFAKDYRHNKTKRSTVSPSFSGKTSTRPPFNIAPSKRAGNINASLPNLRLKTQFRVRNGSDANTTIVFLPRFSRAMNSSSKSSVNKGLQPIIVSKHRRILLHPKDYKIDPKSQPETYNASGTRNVHTKREIPQRFNHPTEPKTIRLKFRESSSSSKNNKTRPFQKPPVQRFDSASKADVSGTQSSSESRVFVKIINENNNGTNVKKKYSITQILSTLKPRSHPLRNVSPKHVRRGRKFNLDPDSATNDKESYSELIISEPIEDKNIKPVDVTTRGISMKLFDYAYSTGKQRDSRITSNRQSSTADSEDATVVPTSIYVPLGDYGALYTEKKAKNLTIYEILKPKLKGSESENQSSPSTILTIDDQNDTDANDSLKNNNNNNSLSPGDTKGETKPFRNTMVILPSRSDSSYGVEYVMVNRNNSAVVFPVTSNETDLSDKSYGFGLRNNNHTVEEEEEEPEQNSVKDLHQQNYMKESQISAPTDLLRIKSEDKTTARSKDSSNGTLPSNSTDENIYYDSSDYMTQLYESDSIRKPKMSVENTPYKNLKLDSKMFYDYFAKKPVGNVTIGGFPYPEFRPGNMFRYSDIYNRKPILEMVVTRPPPFRKLGKDGVDVTTEDSISTPTTFNSLRTSVRVVSTFYPNRMQDMTMKFGNRVESTTLPTEEKLPEFHQDDEFDEYRDAIDPGFTMERLAYLLIGTCCGLSILCLLVVVIAIKCRRSIVEKRLKAQFRKRMYYHEKMKDAATPWQQQMFDHFMYLHRRPGGDSSCSRSTDSCNCRCVTWSLGARNLDSTRPLCSTNRSSSYLCGQKKLPFGAASTLRYESMLGRKRTSPEASQRPHKSHSPNTDSSHENDSLDLDSDSREGDGPKQCTCVDYNAWPMAPSNVPRGFFTMCPNVGRYNVGNCSQHPPVELRTISRDIPPPVTGSNYLDRSEGVVYWSSNDERLI